MIQIVQLHGTDKKLYELVALWQPERGVGIVVVVYNVHDRTLFALGSLRAIPLLCRHFAHTGLPGRRSIFSGGLP